MKILQGICFLALIVFMSGCSGVGTSLDDVARDCEILFGDLLTEEVLIGPELAKLSPAAIWSGFPEAFESDPGNPRVVNGVFRVTMAEVVLDEPEVVALVRQVEAA